MKVLRFRSIMAPIYIRCGAFESRESANAYPFHFKWPTGGGYSEVKLVNIGDKPIKMKIFIDGVLTHESDYIGNPSYQLDLDTFNQNNFHPQETIINITEVMLLAEGTSVSSLADIKVYCPLELSVFELTLECP